MIQTNNFVIVIEKDLDKIVKMGLLFQNALGNKAGAQSYMSESDIFGVYNPNHKLLYIGELKKNKFIQLKGLQNQRNYSAEEYTEINDALVSVGLVDPL